MKRVTVEATSADRFIHLVLALVGHRAKGGTIVYPQSFQSEIEPVDEIAASYKLANWESGLLDGVFAACRDCEKDEQQFLLESMRARLGSDDMTALAVAVAAGAASLLDGDAEKHRIDGWTISVSTPEFITA